MSDHFDSAEPTGVRTTPPTSRGRATTFCPALAWVPERGVGSQHLLDFTAASEPQRARKHV